jgi:hypothetical protein
VKKGSGISPIEEPEWYQIINPIFSDTQGCLQPITQASKILSDDPGDSDRSEGTNMSKESDKTDHCLDNSSNIGDDESENASDLDAPHTSLKRKSAFPNLKVKPIKQNKRVKMQSKDAKSSHKRISQKLWLSWTSTRKNDRNVFTG